MRRRWWIAAVVVALAATAHADREAMLRDARADAIAGRGVDARARLEAHLDVHPNDDEARALLARIDAWSKRWAAAEAGYRAVLARHPGDAEVRAGLVDVLLWSERWAEAATILRDGLALAPDSPDLLRRQATLASWRGELSTAHAAITRAARLAPDDAEIGALADRLWLTEIRIAASEELVPAGYTGTATTRAVGTHRFDRTMLVGAAEVSLRPAAGGGRGTNALYTLAASHAIRRRVRVTIEGGVGAPAVSVARWLARGAVSVPLGPLDAAVVLAHADYPASRGLDSAGLMLAGSRGALQLELAYALQAITVAADRDAELVHAYGLTATWTARPRVALTLRAGRHTELERVLDRSDVVVTVSDAALSVDARLSRRWGIVPTYRFAVHEVSTGVTVRVHGLDAAVYARW